MTNSSVRPCDHLVVYDLVSATKPLIGFSWKVVQEFLQKMSSETDIREKRRSISRLT